MKRFENSRYRVCAGTRIGGRAENQDNFGYYDTPLGFLLLVCDGMGGGPGGKLASSVAVEVIIKQMLAKTDNDDTAKALKDSILCAHSVLIGMTQENPALKGMGTTVAALLINEYAAYVAHVGDSRVYQFRWGHKKFRTFDHSMVFEMLRNKTIKNEEVARLSYQSNVITQALGASSSVKVDVKELPYEKGDRFMVCSDGIWGTMREDKLIKIATQPDNVSEACEGLIVDVDRIGVAEGGHHDNLTVAFLDTITDSIKEEKMNRKTRLLLILLSVICGLSLLGNIIMAFGSREIKELQKKNEALQEGIDQYAKQVNELSGSLVGMSEDLRTSNKENENLKKKIESKLVVIDEKAANTDIDDVIDDLDALMKDMMILANNSTKRTPDRIDGLKRAISKLKDECAEFGISDKDWEYKDKDITEYLDQRIAYRKKKDEKVRAHYKLLVDNILLKIKAKMNK